MRVSRGKLSIRGRHLRLLGLVLVCGSWTTSTTLANCNWSGANLCPGILAWPLNADAKQAYKDIKKAVQDARVIPGKEVGRGPKKFGLYAEFALPSVNSGATNFDLATRIPDHYAVVIGTIHYRENMGTEGYYGVPEAPLPVDAERQTFVLIGEQPNGYPQNDADGKLLYWGRWHLYQTVKSLGVYRVKEVGSGQVRYCHHEMDQKEPVVRFLSCDIATQLFGKSDSSNVRRQDALNYVARIADLARKTNVAFSVEARFQLCARRLPQSNVLSGCWPARIPDSLKITVPLGVPAIQNQTAAIALLQRLVTLDYDESLSPYWFSCGLGCCTADQ